MSYPTKQIIDSLKQKLQGHIKTQQKLRSDEFKKTYAAYLKALHLDGNGNNQTELPPVLSMMKNKVIKLKAGVPIDDISMMNSISPLTSRFCNRTIIRHSAYGEPEEKTPVIVQDNNGLILGYAAYVPTNSAIELLDATYSGDTLAENFGTTGSTGAKYREMTAFIDPFSFYVASGPGSVSIEQFIFSSGDTGIFANAPRGAAYIEYGVSFDAAIYRSGTSTEIISGGYLPIVSRNSDSNNGFNLGIEHAIHINKLGVSFKVKQDDIILSRVTANMLVAVSVGSNLFAVADCSSIQTLGTTPGMIRLPMTVITNCLDLALSGHEPN